MKEGLSLPNHKKIILYDREKYEREVAIPNWVIDLLAEINLHKYDSEWYIFSFGSQGTFLTGKNCMHSNTPTRYWRDIVKSKEGLNMDVNQYSLKKLSGDDMVKLQRREGTDYLLALLKMMMGTHLMT